MIKVINYLHNRWIIHRDIKPENILVKKDCCIIKLIDFGLSKIMYLPLCKMSLNISTLHYWAPELIIGDKQYGLGVDIWSAGLVIYFIKYKQLLFDGRSDIE